MSSSTRNMRQALSVLMVGVLVLIVSISISRHLILDKAQALGASSYQKRKKWSHQKLQRAIDMHASGSWIGDKWISSSPFSLHGLNHTNTDILQTLERIDMDHNLTIGFMGDSTTRSDLRAWEEEFNCPRTDLDERNVFQKLKEDGMSYVCSAREQSMNLTKCLIPPIVNLTNCPRDSAIAFRYFYKIYPWTPLDQWYLKQPDLFQDIDVLVISMGRWFGYYNWNGLPLNVTNDTETFLTQLRKSVLGKDSLPE